MKDNLKKFAAWLLAVAAVMAFYLLLPTGHKRYTVTSSFQGVVLEVLSGKNPVVVEGVKEESKNNPPANTLVPTR